MRSYMQIKDRSPRTWVRENLKIGQVLVISKSWSLFQISPWGNVYWASVLVFLPRIFQSVKLFVHIFMCSWKKMSGDEEAVGDIVTQLSIGRALCCLLSSRGNISLSFRQPQTDSSIEIPSHRRIDIDADAWSSTLIFISPVQWWNWIQSSMKGFKTALN